MKKTTVLSLTITIGLFLTSTAYSWVAFDDALSSKIDTGKVYTSSEFEEDASEWRSCVAKILNDHLSGTKYLAQSGTEYSITPPSLFDGIGVYSWHRAEVRFTNSAGVQETDVFYARVKIDPVKRECSLLGASNLKTHVMLYSTSGSFTAYGMRSITAEEKTDSSLKLYQNRGR